MVAAHFLVSKLELAATSLTPAQPIPTSPSRTPDPTVTFGAIDVGPVTATPFHWHLNPVSSSHLCLAVEISAPNDPLCGTEPARPRTRVARAIGRTSCRLPKAPRGPRGGNSRPGRRHHAGRASPPAGASAGRRRRLSALACDTFGGPERAAQSHSPIFTLAADMKLVQVQASIHLHKFSDQGGHVSAGKRKPRQSGAFGSH